MPPTRPGQPAGAAHRCRLKQLTVSLSPVMYARLEAYAARHHAPDAQPNLAACARALLTQALLTADAQDRQALDPGVAEARRQQDVEAFRARYTGHGRDAGTRGKTTAKRRQHVSPSVFNPHKHVLGRLCERGHDYEGTGQSLRRITTLNCLACQRETNRARHGRDADARHGEGQEKACPLTRRA
jgi:hypothetical protein